MKNKKKRHWFKSIQKPHLNLGHQKIASTFVQIAIESKYVFHLGHSRKYPFLEGPVFQEERRAGNQDSIRPHGHKDKSWVQNGSLKGKPEQKPAPHLEKKASYVIFSYFFWKLWGWFKPVKGCQNIVKHHDQCKMCGKLAHDMNVAHSALTMWSGSKSCDPKYIVNISVT